MKRYFIHFLKEKSLRFARDLADNAVGSLY